jgi:hypothetical protein
MFCSRKCYVKFMKAFSLAMKSEKLRSLILAELAEPLRQAA